jgi:hypothetical protein
MGKPYSLRSATEKKFIDIPRSDLGFLFFRDIGQAIFFHNLGLDKLFCSPDNEIIGEFSKIKEGPHAAQRSRQNFERFFFPAISCRSAGPQF